MSPLYLYYCPICGNQKEEQRLISNRDNLTYCQCGKIMTRSVSQCSFKLVGLGWYKTDPSKNKDYKRIK